MTVLVISHLFEPSANLVIRELERRGVPWARLNCEEFPLFANGEVVISGSEAYGLIATDSGLIDTRKISSVWFRRSSKPAVPKHFSQEDKIFVRNECNAFLNGAFDLITAKWINSRESERSASKIAQLATAASVGLRVPKTLVTNSPEAVRSFERETSGRVAFKPVSGYSPRSADFSKQLRQRFGDQIDIEIENNTENKEFAEIVFNQILTKDKLELIDNLKYCPATFQEYIEKVADIRVTIIGDRVFSCKINSQSTNETKVDFRRMIFLENLKEVDHSEYDLEIDVKEKLIQFMKKMNLVFGCIDLLLAPDGEHIFLEVNPSGQWMWIENMVGFPISSVLVDELVSGMF